MSDTPSSPAPDDLTRLLVEWINTDSWEESQEVLNANADALLSDRALEALDTMLAEYSVEEGEDTPETEMIRVHRTILENARASSIETAYTELAQIMAASGIAEAPIDAFDVAMQAMIGARSSAELIVLLQEHPILRDDETLQAFAAIADQAFQAGDTVLSRSLRWRLDEVRRVLKGQSEAVSRSDFDRERRHVEVEPEQPRTVGMDRIPIDMDVGRGGFGIGINRGDARQFNIEHAELSQPGEGWSSPEAPKLPRGKTFVGRQSELQELLAYLNAGEKVTISGTRVAMNLHGMAGIGKTFLATRVAMDEEIQRRFRGGVITLTIGRNITTESDTQSKLRELASYALQGQQPSITEIVRPGQVAKWLQATAPGPILVIFDDVWHHEPLRLLEQALPLDAVCMVTTRDAEIAQDIEGKHIRLDRLTNKDGIALLEARLSYQGDMTIRQSLQQLVTLLEGHALALDIIAARIKTRVHNRPERLGEVLSRTLTRLGQTGQARLDQLHLREQTRETSVEKSFDLSYEDMTDKERRHFRLLGVFEPETPITLEAALAVWGMHEDDVAQDALDGLTNLAMLEESDNVYRLHGLLQSMPTSC